LILAFTLGFGLRRAIQSRIDPDQCGKDVDEIGHFCESGQPKSSHSALFLSISAGLSPLNLIPSGEKGVIWRKTH
jgi:hypothetical protein